MDLHNLKKKVKKIWSWIWNSNSIWSWLVALALIFLIVKFIFFPTLSLIFGTSLPLAGVESSSMDHQIVRDNSEILTLCGEVYSKQEKKEIGHIDFDEYWEICGDWYVDNKHITKPIFEKFTMKNGFRKGDIIIVWGRFTPKIGDIIIFKPNPGSMAPRPIIHRIVSIDENKIIQTKGDHNKEQLASSNNFYNTDETNIKEEQIIGKAVFKVPYLGWIKIWFTELINIFR
jgi:signal peptidase I